MFLSFSHNKTRSGNGSGLSECPISYSVCNIALLIDSFVIIPPYFLCRAGPGVRLCAGGRVRQENEGDSIPVSWIPRAQGILYGTVSVSRVPCPQVILAQYPEYHAPKVYYTVLSQYPEYHVLKWFYTNIQSTIVQGKVFCLLLCRFHFFSLQR